MSCPIDIPLKYTNCTQNSDCYFYLSYSPSINGFVCIQIPKVAPPKPSVNHIGGMITAPPVNFYDMPPYDPTEHRTLNYAEGG